MLGVHHLQAHSPCHLYWDGGKSPPPNAPPVKETPGQLWRAGINLELWLSVELNYYLVFSMPSSKYGINVFRLFLMCEYVNGENSGSLEHYSIQKVKALLCFPLNCFTLDLKTSSVVGQAQERVPANPRIPWEPGTRSFHSPAPLVAQLSHASLGTRMAEFKTYFKIVLFKCLSV